MLFELSYVSNGVQHLSLFLMSLLYFRLRFGVCIYYRILVLAKREFLTKIMSENLPDLFIFL
jgi:hypothetical protein